MKKRMQNLEKTVLMAALILAVLAGCKKDDDLAKDPPPDQNEEEVITTLTLTFVDSAGTQPTVTATFKDPDGDGGNGPTVFDTISLAAQTTYVANLILLNESAVPTDTISNEVLAEANDHLFCFTPAGVNVTVTLTDSDGTYGIGLSSRWVTGAASSGTVKIVLKHQPGVKDGTCAPGETDAEVDFVTKVQ